MIRGPPRSTLFPCTSLFRSYKAWLGFPSDTCWNELKAISTLHPENPWPHLGMGLIYVRWGLLEEARQPLDAALRDRKSTRLNSSHANISYAAFCLKKTTIRI